MCRKTGTAGDSRARQIKKDECHVFSHLGIHIYVYINIYICVYVYGRKVDVKLSRKQKELMRRGIRGRQKDMRTVFKSYYIVASKWPDVTQNKNLFFIKESDITHISQRNLSTQTDQILVLALHWVICMAFDRPMAKPLGVSDPLSGKRVSGGD